VEIRYSAPFGVAAGKEALRRGMGTAERALQAVTYGAEPVTAARVIWWLWGPSTAARLTRARAHPLAGAYWTVMKLRAARARGDAVRLPLPTIAVGNLSVGGTGKTPLAAWIAAYCAARGRTPGILLRGYGGDEPLVHRRLVPQAVVVANPDRVAGAVAARAQGAHVLVLDDAYQLLGVGGT